LGETSEKGSRRKTTGNRVASWKELFLGESMVSRCFAKEMGWGGLGFWRLWAGVYVEEEGGGGHLCVLRNLLCWVVGGFVSGL
jgi:hypothetical protein